MNKQNTDLVTAIATAVQPKVEEIKRLKADNFVLFATTRLQEAENKQLKAENAKLKARVKELEDYMKDLSRKKYYNFHLEIKKLKARVAELEEESILLKAVVASIKARYTVTASE